MKIVFLSLSLVLISPLTSVAQFFQKSDILLSYPQTESVRDKYSATGIAWGVLPIPPHWDIENRDHFNIFTKNVRTIIHRLLPTKWIELHRLRVQIN